MVGLHEDCAIGSSTVCSFCRTCVCVCTTYITNQTTPYVGLRTLPVGQRTLPVGQTPSCQAAAAAIEQYALQCPRAVNEVQQLQGELAEARRRASECQRAPEAPEEPGQGQPDTSDDVWHTCVWALPVYGALPAHSHPLACLMCILLACCVKTFSNSKRYNPVDTSGSP